jgi:hypothetical protein
MRLWGSVVRTAIDVCGGVALLLWLVMPLGAGLFPIDHNHNQLHQHQHAEGAGLVASALAATAANATAAAIDLKNATGLSIVANMTAGSVTHRALEPGAYFGGSSLLLSVIHHAGQLLHLDVMQGRIRWLMQQPAGAKLNQVRYTAGWLADCLVVLVSERCNRAWP